MKYIKLGKSDLEISIIGLGTMHFGSLTTDRESFNILDYYYEVGGNFLDTANIYSKGNTNGQVHEQGKSEQIIGAWLQNNNDKREKVIIGSKVGMDMGDEYAGLSRDAIFHQVDNSLKRLCTDYIDLYQVHAPDDNTDIVETISALEELKKKGKIRYYGCCNFTNDQLRISQKASANLAVTGFVSSQNCYNLIVRNHLSDYFLTKDEATDIGIGTICYKVLGGGFLTGKYRPGKDLPDSPSKEVIKKRCYNEQAWKLLNLLDELSNKYGKPIAQVALAWHSRNQGLDCSLIGVRSLEQLQNCLEDSLTTIDLSDYEKIDLISKELP